MDVKFSKDAGDNSQQGGEKGKQNMLLVVLLVLVAGFGYIYFFTGLIKPAPEQKVAEAPPVVQAVKKPLPSPDGKPAKVGEGDEGDGKKVAAATPKPEPVKVDPTPAPAPVAKPAAKPAVQEPVKPPVEVKKAEVPQAAVKKPLPSATAKVEKKPAPAEKKPAAAVEKKALPSKDGEKKVVEAKKPAEKSVARADVATPPKKDVQKPARKESAVPADAATTGRWTVLVGNYVLEEAMATDLGRIRKAGCEAYIVPGAQKKNHMNRLLLAEFTDRASAQTELDKLKRLTSDAFIIDSAGMHAVYAGSYLLDERASSEKARLAAAGFNLTLKRAAVSIATKNLTAGSFADKSAAEDVQKKLRAAGVKATLTR